MEGEGYAEGAVHATSVHGEYGYLEARENVEAIFYAVIE